MSISFVYGCIGGTPRVRDQENLNSLNSQTPKISIGPLYPPPPPFLMEKNHGFVPVVSSKRDLE